MAVLTNGGITIKGVRDGLLVILPSDGDFASVHALLSSELKEKFSFLLGSRIILQTGKRPFTKKQLITIYTLFGEHKLDLWAVLGTRAETREAARELGLATRLAGSHTDLDGNVLHEEKTAVSNKAPQANSLLLRETFRSGRSVQHDGHVIIIGDVNPGAEITAGGNVIVWGRLRGLVHAGAYGDETAVICALDLNPTQLRIAGQIAIPPQENGRKPTPEQAIIRDGQIIAESW